LEGKTNIVPRKVMYYYYINMAKPRSERNDLEAVRYDNWKLVFPHTYLSVAVDGGIGKNGYPGKPKILSTQRALYDLSHDQGERYNIISLYPEITQKLLKIADEARSDLGDDLTSTPGKNIRPAITY
jgi:arylsulfatase